jgi:hypothetical protein
LPAVTALPPPPPPPRGPPFGDRVQFSDKLAKGLSVCLSHAELAALHARYLSPIDARWVDGFRFQV